MANRTANKLSSRSVRRPSLFANSSSSPFEVWEAELDFTEWVCAGIPANGKAMAAWIRKNAGVEQTEEIRRMMLAHLEEIGVETNKESSFDEIVKASEAASVELAGNVFKRDDNGIYVESRQFKSMLKEATEVLFKKQRFGYRPAGHPKGGYTGKAAQDYVAEVVHTCPERIYFGLDEPTGINTSIVKTKLHGTSFTTYEYVEHPTLTVTVKMVEDSMKPENMEAIWMYCEENGFGARRSQGSGKFNLVRWERVA